MKLQRFCILLNSVLLIIIFVSADGED